MPKIGTITTFRVEDFDAEQRAWLPRLFLPLNQFVTKVNNCLNGRVDFGPNIPCQDTTLTFSYDGSPQRFTWNMDMAPKILWVGQCAEAGLPITLLAEWSFDSSTTNVSVGFRKLNAAGLDIGTQYSVFLRIVP